MSLDDFFTSSFNYCFVRKLNEIVQEMDTVHEFDYKFRRLLDQYREFISWEKPELKFASDFLTNFASKNIVRWIFNTLKQKNLSYLYQSLDKLAAAVHNETKNTLPSQTQNALRAVLPSVFEEHKDKSYVQVVEAYVKSGLRPERGPVTRREFRNIILEVLETPEMSRLLSPMDASILNAFKNQEPATRDFFDFVYQQNCQFDYKTCKNGPNFWYLISDCYFSRFSHTAMHQAQDIFQTVIIPSHPFFAELANLHIQIETVFSQHNQTFHKAIELIIHQIFTEQWTRIFSSTDALEDPQYQLLLLLQKYKGAMSWKTPAIEYSCIFLMNLRLEDIKDSVVTKLAENFDFYHRMHEFAAIVYEQLNARLPLQAQTALKRVVPSVYQESRHKGYTTIMKKYLESKVKPQDPAINP